MFTANVLPMFSELKDNVLLTLSVNENKTSLHFTENEKPYRHNLYVEISKGSTEQYTMSYGIVHTWPDGETEEYGDGESLPLSSTELQKELIKLVESEF